MSEASPAPGEHIGQREARLSELEARLGHVFANRSLLECALQHSSYAHETEGAESNERLEFLGDAILGLVVAHALFEAHPDWSEGDLTRGLASLVDRRSLARVARGLSLGDCLLLGRTEQRSGGSEKASILADATEAVLGALYLDAGTEVVERFARLTFADALLANAPRVERDPKTELNERVMAESGEFPVYALTRDSGVEDDDLRFSVQVQLQGEAWGEGSGRTKRAAEVAAAKAALERGLADG